MDSISNFANAAIQSYNIVIAKRIHATGEFLPLIEVDWDWRCILRHSDICSRSESLSNHQNASIQCDCLGLYWYIIKNEDVEYLLGPACSHAITEQNLQHIGTIQSLPAEEIAELKELRASIPVYTCEEFMRLGILFYIFTNGTFPTFGKGDTTTQNDVGLSLIREDVRYSLQQRDFELAVQAEQMLRSVVRTGDMGSVKKLLALANKNASASLGSDIVRSTKNNAIVAISVMTRASIDGGLPVEVAFPLSDLYITRLEQTPHLSSMSQVVLEALFEFTATVRANRHQVKGSPFIKKCCGYIVSNMDRSIRVSEIAKEMDMHPDTLERRFKREMGLSLTQYIATVKMEQAKLLLLYTDKSFADIACELGYGSQGYFDRVFKKIYSISPVDFRRKNRQ